LITTGAPKSRAARFASAASRCSVKRVAALSSASTAPA
jgi:hypothetical protein